jgi:hypothetical protein
MANASHVKAINHALVRSADIPAKTLARLCSVRVRGQPLAISRFKGPGQA